MESPELGETDEAIIARVRESSPELYGEIIRRYQPKLTRYIRRFTSDVAAQEDILQDVFIKAYKNLYAFDIERSFSSWIYRIAHNEAINFVKKAHREPLFIDEKEWEVADERLDIGSTMEKEHAVLEMRNALNKIKKKYRQPLILFFFEDKSYEEISDILRLPRSTVGTLISRGKTQLKEILHQQ